MAGGLSMSLVPSCHARAWSYPNLTVAPRAQGQGVGRALMRHIFAEAHKVGISEFLCFSSLEAEAFYQNLGFVVLQRQELSLPTGRKIPMIRMKSSALSSPIF